MIKLQVIGNLGADAEIKSIAGREYISFRVANTKKTYRQRRSNTR